MKKLLVSYKIPYEGIKHLEKDFEIIYPSKTFFTKDEIIARIDDCDVLLSIFSMPVDRDIILAARNLKLISNALKIEHTWGLFTLPSALIVGILVSRHYNGYTIMETFTDPSYFLKIIIMMVVILPIAFITTNKLNKSAFGKYIDNLKENITRMELIQ